ncbi:RhoGAP-domain-containing protein [Phellopilus nigrolimitatus]|nr:RhoGAP-domain-containing protein [Phellopilus nigrolimitatus]
MPPPLTLKQRLANLSLAASAPSTPLAHSPPTTPRRSPSFSALNSAIGKRKAFLNPPWSNSASRTSAGYGDEQDSAQKVDDVLSRMIFQAGVDYETRPRVIMNASAFPDPRTVSYDLLLFRILSYLDLFVESDYTIVFFAAGGHHTPSWNWVWKAYRSLNRKYRKNLKRLYIVHSSFFSKMLFSLAGAIISPKFFRKIAYIDTLSSLACHVPLTQIDIPPAVYSENLKHESQISLPTASYSRMFGISLEELMGFDGEKDGLPRVVRDCIQYLRETGLEEEGLFRRSPNSAQLRQVREAYNRGQTVSLRSFNDPHLAAVLLKKFLRDLPKPIFPESTYDAIRRCPNPRDEQDELAAIMYIRDTLLPELSPCTLIVLSNILLLLHEVSFRSDTNRMDAHNLAVVLTPNLVASGNPLKDVALCTVAGSPEPLSPGTRPAPPLPGAEEAAKAEGKMTLGTIIKLCIQRYFEVFDELADRAEAINADPFRVGETDEAPSSSSSSSPNQSASPSKRFSFLHDDEDSIDDAMLVMPVGPNSTNPSARKPLEQLLLPSSARSVAPSSGSAVRSVMSGESRSANRFAAAGSMSKAKARSLMSPSPSADGLANRRGGRAVGGGLPVSASATLRKAAGAGVSAHSVTASGFFTPPGSASSLSERQSERDNAIPPVPPLHPMSAQRNGRRDN